MRKKGPKRGVSWCLPNSFQRMSTAVRGEKKTANCRKKHMQGKPPRERYERPGCRAGPGVLFRGTFEKNFVREGDSDRHTWGATKKERKDRGGSTHMGSVNNPAGYGFSQGGCHVGSLETQQRENEGGKKKATNVEPAEAITCQRMQKKETEYEKAPGVCLDVPVP